LTALQDGFSILTRLIFDVVYGSRTLSIKLCTLDIIYTCYQFDTVCD